MPISVQGTKTISTITETCQLFDVVEEESADGGADADVVRERTDDGEDSGLHLRICGFNFMGNFLYFCSVKNRESTNKQKLNFD